MMKKFTALFLALISLQDHCSGRKNIFTNGGFRLARAESLGHG